jgi:glycosyltransferase involved in cell wall biosynthesis
MNLTAVDRGVGSHILPSHKWTPLPAKIAEQVACEMEYRADDARLRSVYKFREADGIHLGWSSPFFYSDGYGSIGQEIAATFLDNLGVKLSILPRDYDPRDPRLGGVDLDRWEKDAFVPHSIVEQMKREQDPCFYGINMTWPRDVQHHRFVRGLGYTMFETTHPPKEWSKCLNMCRRIITPCHQNKKAFEDIGVTVPIHVVQHGVNPTAWPTLSAEVRGSRSQPFTFLCMAGLTYRKNPVGAAWAFVKAFPRKEEVRLILKTREGRGFWHWENELPQDDRIVLIKEESTPTQMVEWMHRADCFLFLSRSEGFGLTPVQAMATGLPLIVSDNSGMSEYCDDRFNYPIPCREVPVPDCKHGGYPDDWGYCGNWWEPDEDAAIATMRQVYRNRDYGIGKRAAEWVRERWTVERCCNGLLDVVMQDAAEEGIN